MESDKVHLLHKQVDDIKSDMIYNIDKIMARSEDLGVISNKTDALQSYAKHFQQNTRTALRKARSSYTLKVIMVLSIFIVLILLIAFMLRAVFKKE